ncbi:DUF2867 domain-containing protein [Phyllobacterium salinisoli]|uniref:DUF2867 domain-containing protein n=1 Tax=Phyllobacterium salinisoli TaxID=1899321 RepID=A0A368JY28_9HYPH|nr:DUF2867 domain-containing protein [Phyllobacterium salinisoli]RCS22058.1 DUF2867 domain-containing protein [Phyllobacterium salinisoli]
MTKPISKPFPHPDRLLPGANFGDAFSLTVKGLELDALGAAQQVFGRAPGWIKQLLTLRDLIVRPFGLTSGGEPTVKPDSRIGILPIIGQSTDRVVLGLDDRHLDFRVLIEITERGAAWQEISVSTAVKTHNPLGRVYLAIVKPFHRIIVPAMLMQVVPIKVRRTRIGFGQLETVASTTPHPATDRRLAFKTAVQQSEETLREVIRENLRGGAAEADLLADLETIRNELSEEVEDRVLNVMDLLIGWCGPHARLSRDDPERPDGISGGRRHHQY